MTDQEKEQKNAEMKPEKEQAEYTPSVQPDFLTSYFYTLQQVQLQLPRQSQNQVQGKRFLLKADRGKMQLLL